ncbi:MAG: MFS transporter [Candidatus Dormibacteraeota bacterium]|nr:MFS transporter [Candidatus Dormibacteraeota bacterium]
MRAWAQVKRTFQSLSVRNYRLFFTGQAISVNGTWIQTVAQAWLVLHLTGNGVDLGITTALQFLPVLILGTWGGAVADRVDKRRALYLTQGGFALSSGVLATLVLTGHATIWAVWAFALVSGFARVFDNPIRQAFASEMVGSKLVANAVSLNSSLFTSARIIGPSIAGALIALVGTGWCFAINGASYVAVLIALLMMNPAELYRSAVRRTRAGGLRQISEGLRYIWGDPELRVPLMMMAVIGLLAINFNVILPLVATRIFHGGPGLYGGLYAAMGVGAFTGALYMANRARPTMLLLIIAALIFGAGLLVAAGIRILPLELAVLVPAGAGMTLFQAGTNSSLQIRANPEFRGRVLSIYVLLFNGTTPIGGPIIGWVAQQFGADAALAVGGASAVIVAVLAYVWLRGYRRRTRTEATTSEVS